MNRYWARFWTGLYEDEGCQKPPFPIWITDHKERSEDTDRDDCSVCGVMNADSKDAVLQQISNYFRSTIPHNTYNKYKFN